MALSDVALCSRALIRIGAAPITSFADGSVEADIASALFVPVRDGLLSAYAWGFATGQAQLAELAQPPIADYTRAFGLPSDYLRWQRLYPLAEYPALRALACIFIARPHR